MSSFQFAILFLLALEVSAEFNCRNERNEPVDWFAVYKMPIYQDTSANGIKDGLAFYYLDSNDPTTLRPSPNNLNSSQQPIAYTLQQLYDKNGDLSVFSVMYNDEPYEESESAKKRKKRATVQKGHTKGVVFSDQTSGIWLVHSVPAFPPPDHYKYPNSGTIYGQTMLCISFDYSELAKIGTQLYYNHPDIYHSNLPTAMIATNPDLALVIGGKYMKEINHLDCQAQYAVKDAMSIHVGLTGEFSYTKDHTKMARSSQPTKPYVCIGDINRMTSQFSRGGGTLCLLDQNLWQAFDVITTENVCPV
ncbi:unnamed protein product, partial [Mesorhabditis spiculigera]